MTVALAAASAWLTFGLVRHGLKRLDRGAYQDPGLKLSLYAVAGILVGVTIGGALMMMGNRAGPLLYASILYPGLLITAARIDYCTGWAPSEMTVPICILTVVLASGCWASSAPGLLACIAGGIMLFLGARIAWMVQVRIGKPMVPPADIIALVMPTALFGVNMLSFACYLLLCTALLFIWSLPGGAGRWHVADGFPLLAVAYPLVVLFMLAVLLSGLIRAG